MAATTTHEIEQQNPSGIWTKALHGLRAWRADLSSRVRDDRGDILIESVIASFLIAIIASGLVLAALFAARVQVSNHDSDSARQLANTYLDRVSTLPWTCLGNDPTGAQPAGGAPAASSCAVNATALASQVHLSGDPGYASRFTITAAVTSVSNDLRNVSATVTWKNTSGSHTWNILRRVVPQHDGPGGLPPNS